ncbi:MAG: Trm112 family protein [Hyphomicrobiaceae bacterium]
MAVPAGGCNDFTIAVKADDSATRKATMTSEDRETHAETASDRSIDPRLLAILVCPITKHRLELDAASGELISKAASLAFPIRDGVPILTLDAARPIETDPALKGR